MNSWIVLRRIALIAALAMGPAWTSLALAADRIQPGDLLKVDYACRLKNGELAAATDAGSAEGSDPKSPVFAPPPSFSPVMLRAGEGLFCEERGALLPLKPFESEIAVRLSEALVGRAVGRTERVEISAAEQLDLPREERIVSLGRQERISKTMRLSREIYRQRFPSEPKEGQAVDLFEQVEGRVTKVNDQEVEIRFKARPAEQLKSPYGRVSIREQGDHFLVEVDVAEGRLVRFDRFVGRVSSLTETQFSLDFGHPFGGETLICEVNAERASEEAFKTASGEPACPDTTQAAARTAEAKTPSLAGGREAQAGGPVKAPAQVAETPGIVQEGDLIEVDFTVTLDDGTLVNTTLHGVADDPKRRKIEGFSRPEPPGPAALVAGRSERLPGMGSAVIGLHAKERKSFSISPENTFGSSDPRRMARYRKTNLVDKQKSMTAKEFIGRFQEFPVIGREVPFNQYLKALVTGADAETANLKLFPAGDRFVEPYGEVRVAERGEQIAVSLTPKIGAAFVLDDQAGRIIADDSEMFTVDYNHALAGQRLNVELEVLSLVKASALRDKQIVWIEDHDDGLKNAQSLKKPAVLVLYASWCSYSKKLFDEAIADPRVRQLGDDFVWVKIDSHTHREFKEAYQQESYPLTVVLSPEGEVLKALKGFRSAEDLRRELKQVLGQKKQLAKH